MKEYNTMLEDANSLAKFFKYEDIRKMLKLSADAMSDDMFDMYVHAMVISLRQCLLEYYSSQDLHPL